MKLKAVLPLVLVAVLAVGVYMDTAAFRSAMQTPQLTQQTIDQMSRLEADMQRYGACGKLRDDQTTMFTASARDCFVQAMGKTDSALGAVAYSVFAMNWLIEHPADSEVRSAALASIEKGRTALTRESTYYRAWEHVYEAHDRSVLLSLRDGKQSGHTRFVQFADELDKAQYRVMLPDVAKAQSAWRMQAYAI
jgi:hypothetical protein